MRRKRWLFRRARVEGRGTVNEELRRAVGLADACELMAAAWAFPTPELIAAVTQGTFSDDAISSLRDVGVVSGDAIGPVFENDAVSNEDLLAITTRGYSLLFLAPGTNVLVFPYESAFRHRALKLDGAPVLFRSPVTLDVERHMRKAGVMPTDARREPSDSVWNEFSFLSFLYGNAAAAMYEGRDEEVKLWRERVTGFWREHGSVWLPAFMEQTRLAATDVLGGELYAAFAEMGQLVLEAIAMDVPVSTASSEE